MNRPGQIGTHRSWLRLIAAIVVMQVLFGVHRWLPEHRFWLVLLPSMEVALVTALLCVALIFRPSARHALWVVALLIAPLALFAVGEALTRHIYDQPFVPLVDVPFVIPLLSMVLGREETISDLILIPAVAVPLAALGLLLWGLLRGMVAALGRLSRRALVTSASLALTVILAAVVVGLSPLPVLFARQWKPEQYEPLVDDDPHTQPEPTEQYALPGIRDVDVVMIVVESYGHTLLTHPPHRELIAGAMAEVDLELTRMGYSIASTVLDSPTSGGRSWLADATLLTGVRVDSQHLYETILLGDSPNLTRDMGRAGYHRVMAAPGTTETTEPWRAFYQFDQYYTQQRFGYRGPHFSFGAMPDQFSLNVIRKEVLAEAANAPLFLQLMLVSSHVPFDRVPHYVDDWDAIGDGSEWETAPNPRFRNNWLTGGEYPEGFTASIQYVLRVISEFIRHYVPEDALVIVVGDHQPRYPIREREATMGVLMHVISRDTEVVSAFMPHGFVRGFVPPVNHPLVGMESFYGIFLDVASGRSRRVTSLTLHNNKLVSEETGTQG